MSSLYKWISLFKGNALITGRVIPTKDIRRNFTRAITTGVALGVKQRYVFLFKHTFLIGHGYTRVNMDKRQDVARVPFHVLGGAAKQARHEKPG